MDVSLCRTAGSDGTKRYWTRVAGFCSVTRAKTIPARVGEHVSLVTPSQRTSGLFGNQLTIARLKFSLVQ